MVSPIILLNSFTCLCPLLLSLVHVTFGASLPVRQADAQVTGKETVYIGTQSNNQDIFLGIPFAQPPVDDLRFWRPVAATPGPIVEALNYGPRCMQSFPANDTSEDCLTLNVWRPRGVKGPLPVMVWIYGGSFILGESSSYPGDNIVAASVSMGQPVIYVSLNYRLGFFGFPVGSQTMGKGTTNLGLYDQRMAIEWVQNNIGYFGGDPQKVTLFGESSGAMGVSYQMMYKGGQIGNAFRAAIMQSGAPTSYKSAVQNTGPRQKAYDEIASLTGCKHAPDSFECLRALDVDKLQEAHIATYVLPPSSVAFANFPTAYGPVTDSSDDFLPIPASSLIAAGRYAHIPMISGSNLDEGTWFASNPKSVLDIIAFMSSSDAGLSLSINPFATVPLLFLYPDNPSQGSPYNTGNELFGRERQYKRAASFIGDYLFTAPRRYFTRNAVLRNSAVWSYLFVQPSGGPPVYGISHASEIPYVFGFIAPNKTDDIEVSTRMRQYWINFATQLNPRPSGSSLPDWPSYGSSKKMIQFKAGSYPTITDSFRELGTWAILNNPIL